MICRLTPQVDSRKYSREPHSGSKLPYCTVKEMRKLYPDGNFAVLGEIGGVAKFPYSGDLLITGIGKAIPILPRGSLKKPFEWIVGYVAVEKKTISLRSGA